MSFIDLFSERSDLYAAARPTYPPALFAFLAERAPGRARAWDCACGNGQAAVGLAEQFDAVEATDASAEQIAHGMASPRVRYSVQRAESTEFPADYFDAVCVAQALHWFDLDRFYEEVHRVLRPGGLFAVWGYSWAKIAPELDAVIRHTVLDVVAPYWAPNNQLVWDGYRHVAFPFEEFATEPFTIRTTWAFPQLMAHIMTWSATRRCLEAQGAAWFDSAETAIGGIWGAPERTRTILMPVHIRAGYLARRELGEDGN